MEPERSMKKHVMFFWLFLIPFSTYSQGDQLKKSIEVLPFEGEITIDGKLDEDFWDSSEPATDFWQYFPTDSVLAEAQTEIQMRSDENNLYIGIKCYGAGNNWLVNSLKRDYRAGGNDNITLIFDSFDDDTNGMFFGINPEGVIREGVVSNGGNGFRDFSESWDNKWKGESTKYDGFYTAELAIPFSTLRYNPHTSKWGFVAYRFDTQNNEISVWNRVPRNQTMFNLAYGGDMVWKNPIKETGRNISIIPFITGGYSKNYEENTPAETVGDIGGDVKIAITSGLNLDLTVNPDFSQVEVDRQITNLDRFEIFFPERRQFFIENADLFGSFGSSTINPFFSRRIGVGRDINTDETIQNRIIGGARLSGKLDNNTRVGLLNMQTASSDQQGLPSINYSVAVVQRKILSRSNVGFIFVNKQSSGDIVEVEGLPTFNRVAGVDFNYANASNTWFGKTFVQSTFSPESSTKWAHGTELNYNKRAFGITWRHDLVQDDFNAEVGFVRRRNFFRVNPRMELRYYPQTTFVNEYAVGFESEVFWRPGFGKTDHNYQLGIDGQFPNGSRFALQLNHDFVHLFNDFDPTGTSSAPLLAGTSYNYLNFTGFMNTDRRKRVSTSFRAFMGGYFNGWRSGLSGNLTFRYQPKGSVNLTYSWNIFDLDHLEGTRQTFLIGPRVDYTFSKSLFATAFIQYNTQSKNTNINTRLQWRFAPVSDFFLVITDNYFTGNPGDPSDRFLVNLRNRAIVAKLTYWINA